MKEEEAKTKWCPLVRRAGEYGNADADGLQRPTKCVGSACMMWRWSSSPCAGLGYCGLAGKPLHT